MKLTRNFSALLLGTALLCAPSCQVNELLTTDIEAKELSLEEENHMLIEKARHAEAEAFHELAIRHRDGIGVPKDIFRAFVYQGIYCDKTGEITPESINIFEEGSLAHAFVEMWRTPYDDENIRQKLDEMSKQAPDEAAALRIMIDMDKREDYTSSILGLEELEKRGSIFAVLLQLMYYDNTHDEDHYEALLDRAVMTNPFYHSLLADFYERKYNGIDDLHWIEKAKEHYEMADRYALLTPRFARQYYQMLEHFNNEKLIPCSTDEIERIKRLSQKTAPLYEDTTGK